MTQSKLNLEVYNKRNGTRGIVVAESEDTLTIQTDGVNKMVTMGTFKRWYNIVPQENAENAEPVSEPTQSAESLNEDKKTDKSTKRVQPAGEYGIGKKLRDKFVDLVKYQANQSLDFTYDDKNNRVIIKYNGKNVFECTTANKRFNVLCHPKALTPDNLQRANNVFPKEWGWALSAKFVFTDLSQVPLMKSIITDSLYYRQWKEN